MKHSGVAPRPPIAEVPLRGPYAPSATQRVEIPAPRYGHRAAATLPRSPQRRSRSKAGRRWSTCPICLRVDPHVRSECLPDADENSDEAKRRERTPRFEAVTAGGAHEAGHAEDSRPEDDGRDHQAGQPGPEGEETSGDGFGREDGRQRPSAAHSVGRRPRTRRTPGWPRRLSGRGSRLCPRSAQDRR